MKRTVVTFLVSYDAEYLKISLPIVYPYPDKIVLAVDRERLTWKGNRFELPDDFFDWIKNIDVHHKISIYEDTFYLPGKKTLELDSRQRQMAAEYAGLDNTWHIQIDADEYAINFEEIISRLRDDERIRENCDGISYMAKPITLFKRDDSGFFFIDIPDSAEKIPLAASSPQYIAARKTVFKEQFTIDAYIVHQTFARDYDSLKWKFDNWGHSDDFNTNSYLNLWQAIDRYNYKYLANFHPNYHVAWKKLSYIEAKNIHEFIEKFIEILKSRPSETEKKPPVRTRMKAMVLRIIKKAASWL